jgi:AraC-like DNA-binding protein
MMMPERDGISRTLLLNFEAWRALLRTICGRYNPEGIEHNALIGWVRPMNVCGLAAVDIAWNAQRVERTHRDIRLDGAEHYYASFQVCGKLAMTQNDPAVQLAASDVVLVDARPGGTPAGRLLFGNDADTDNRLSFASADDYMQLVVYDLAGALFAPSDSQPISRPTGKLFARICGVIKHGFSDPDFGPVEVAAAAGISLRYLQKLFTERGSTCSEFIYSLRLDHAARLLRRRALLGTGQPLSEIAYACGFRDYAHFARKFRQRFGNPPGAHAGNDQSTVGGTVRPGIIESALSAHDVQPPAA